MGGDLFENRSQGLIGLRRPARHDRGAVERALLAAGDPGADEVQAAFPDRLLPADGVGVKGVAAIDDDVARIHGVGEVVDHGVGCRTRLDHDQHPAGLLQRGDELLDGLRAHERPVRAMFGQQCVGFGDRTVVQGHGVTVAGEVAGDVGTHHRQAADADLGERFLGGAHRAPFVAGWGSCRVVGFRDGDSGTGIQGRGFRDGGSGTEYAVQLGEPRHGDRDGWDDQHRGRCEVGGQ